MARLQSPENVQTDQLHPLLPCLLDDSIIEENQFACYHVMTHICAVWYSSQHLEDFLGHLISLIPAPTSPARQPEPHWTVENITTASTYQGLTIALSVLHLSTHLIFTTQTGTIIFSIF